MTKTSIVDGDMTDRINEIREKEGRSGGDAADATKPNAASDRPKRIIDSCRNLSYGAPCPVCNQAFYGYCHLAGVGPGGGGSAQSDDGA